MIFIRSEFIGSVQPAPSLFPYLPHDLSTGKQLRALEVCQTVLSRIRSVRNISSACHTHAKSNQAWVSNKIERLCTGPQCTSAMIMPCMSAGARSYQPDGIKSLLCVKHEQISEVVRA